MKRIAVFGLGQFGMPLTLALAEQGAEVLAFDTDEAHIDQVKDVVAHAVILDCTDERALQAQGLDKVDAAVIAIGEDFEANVLGTLLLKNFEIPRVITRAATWAQDAILRRIGADEVITPEEEAARRLARRLTHTKILDHFGIGEHLALIEMPTPEAFVGHTLRELELRTRYGANLVAVEHRPGDGGERDIDVPHADYELAEGDLLYVAGRDEDLAVLTEV